MAAKFYVLRSTVLVLILLVCATAVKAQCSSSATDAADEDIFNVTFGTLNNSSTCATLAPGAGSVQNRYSNYTGVAAPNVTQCQTVNFSVQIGTCGGNYNNAVRIFIDWNNDADFQDAGEIAYTSAAATSGPHTENGTITIPGNAAVGNIRMRVVNVETATPTSISDCGTYTWGETEDYRINILAGSALTYTSSTVTQIVSGTVDRCATNRQIIGVQVVMGAGCSSNLTQFQLGAGSSTSLATDVASIRIYYTGTSNTFAATNEFVPGGTTPTGATNTINGAQALVSGTNYFWICYDLNPGANVGNAIDGACSQLVIAGVNRIPTVTNPAGSGTIAACLAPGGVGGATLWLKANAGTNTTTDLGLVSSWASQAVSPAVTVTQATAGLQPTYRVGAGTGTNNTTNRFNYNPFIYTDGTSNRLTAAGNIDLGVITNGMTAFQAIGEDLGVVSMEWYHSANGNIKFKGDGLMYFNNANGSTQQNVAIGPYTQQAFIQDLKGIPGGINGNGRDNGLPCSSYNDGWRVASVTGISIGSNMDNGEFMQGGMGEYIVYPSVLTATNVLKIESYLAIKYGTTLGNAVTPTNYLSSAAGVIWTANAPYQQNIIGIGRDDNSGLVQRQSHQYDDTVRIYLGTLATTNLTNASAFSADQSFVVMGANTGKLCATAASVAEMPVGLAGCTLYSRLEREWCVKRTNMGQNFSLDIKLNACGAPGSVNVAHLRLLVDDDGNFANGGTQCYYNGDGTGIVFSYTNPTITVSGISTTHIPNNATRYITIASINAATPLPVELVHFDAKLNDARKVVASWITETEINTSQFELYRSTDFTNWELVGSYPAAGISTSTLHYEEVDPQPFVGLSFYQLKTIDQDGASSLSEMRSVMLEAGEIISLFPNPASKTVTVSGHNIYYAMILFTDGLGKRVAPKLVAEGKNQVTFDVSELAEGIYFVQLIGHPVSVMKLVVK